MAMLWDFLRIYATIHTLYFILALYLLNRFSQDIATKLEYNSFRFLLGVYFVYLLLSVSCTYIEYGNVYLPEWLVWAIWTCTIFSVVLIASSLFMFTVFRYAPHLPKKFIFSFLTSIPLLTIVVLLLASLRNGLVIDVTPDHHIVFGPLYPVISYLVMPYFAAILVFAAIKYRGNSSYIRRGQLRTLVFAVLFVLASGIADLQFAPAHVSILPTSSLMCIIFLNLNMLDSGVYTDMLTGMNNRRKANEYLGEYLLDISEEKPVYLYMCDVNYFKKINDEYGHAEGDQALILTAKAIKSAVSSRNSFAARLSGDEFLIACFPESASDAEAPEALIEDVQKCLSEKCAAAQKPYSVTISIGCVCCEDPRRPLSDYIREADEALYVRKRAFHAKS
ncbi:MAG: diguanylate cyclase [Ruminococcaceae bacterium]|nr:diguanylate cyclase [Oscillospiraceae bacterium]